MQDRIKYIVDGNSIVRHHFARHFDIMTTAHTEQMQASGAGVLRVIEKGFMPAELNGLLEEAGFRVLSIWGGTAGGWSKAVLKLDELEITMLTQRK